MYGANLATIPAGVDGHAVLAEVRARLAGPEGPPQSLLDEQPYLQSDHMLVRFIIARQWDVEEAWRMLKEHYQWRTEKRIMELIKDPFPEAHHIKRYYPQAFHGTDKLGRPIYIERPGKIEMERILQALRPERLLDYIFAGSELQVQRRLPACSLARGQVIDKSLNILDLEGMGFGMVTHSTARRVLGEVITTIQNHYPEMMGKMVIINAPKVFSMAWKIAKPRLDEKTVTKISIFNSNREAYSRALLELVDAHQLPSIFGGTCMCDGKDPESCMLCEKGPWLDPEIIEILDSEPLEQLMTPEGSRVLLERRGTVEGGSPRAGAAREATPGQASAEPSRRSREEEEEEARDETPADLPSPVAAARPELSPDEQRVADLIEEYQKEEEAHMKTLAAWVEAFNSFSRDIGQNVIERAQGYYDTRNIWQQVVQEYARQQAEADQVSKELDAAVATLSKAEASITGEGEQLTDEQFNELIPLDVDDPVIASEPKLLRTYKVSLWTDKVTRLQWQRDSSQAELRAKRRDLEESKKRFEGQEALHRTCTGRCSVKRAAPFYEKRRLHESTVDAQIATLQSIETRLHEARRAVIQARGGKKGSVRGTLRTISVDEMSLQSFELAGAEPHDEEFMSCSEESIT